MTPEENRFIRELDLSRAEIEEATQYLYAYLAMHAVAKRRPRVLRAFNEHPLFWNTAAGALQSASIVTLGRIFDQDSPHNIDALLRLASKPSPMFSRRALAIRKHASPGPPPAWVAAFVAEAHEPVPADFRSLRKVVGKVRRTYELRFRDLRHKLYAHKEVHGQPDVAAVTSKANINELKRLLSVLAAVNEALFQLFWNGRPLVVHKRGYAAKPTMGQPSTNGVHERIFADVEEVLLDLTRPKERMEPRRPGTHTGGRRIRP